MADRAVGQTGDEDSRLEPAELLQVAEVLVVVAAGKQHCNYHHKASIWNSSSSSSTASGRQQKTLARVLLIAVAAWYCSARLVAG